MDKPSVSVLFVCFANYCRSPMAEAVFRELVARAGLSDRIHASSAGVGVRREGITPHPETLQILEQGSIPVTGLGTRRVEVRDLQCHDWVLASDRAILRQLQEMGTWSGQLDLLLSFDSEDVRLDVPDPFVIGGFDEVFRLTQRACIGLLEQVRRRHGL